MSDQPKAEQKHMKRCGEKVKYAIIDNQGIDYAFPVKTKNLNGPGSPNPNVDAMALHPWGLFVNVKGERFILPHSSVRFVKPADDET